MLLHSATLGAAAVDKPNIVWVCSRPHTIPLKLPRQFPSAQFLTDDQDQMLGGSFPPTSAGGATPMPKTQRLLAEQGVTAENWYIHTPICSPSRSELVTGRYLHNIKQVGGSGYCAGMHVNYSKVNGHTFARVLSEQAGYAVGLFGKYLNVMPKQYPPPGFDAWLANGGGTYISPQFQTHNIDGLPDGGWTGSVENYTTAVVGNASIAWINKVAAAEPARPWFAYVAPKAAHSRAQHSTAQHSMICYAAMLQGGARALHPGAVAPRPLGPRLAGTRAAARELELLGALPRRPPRQHRERAAAERAGGGDDHGRLQEQVAHADERGRRDRGCGRRGGRARADGAHLLLLFERPRLPAWAVQHPGGQATRVRVRPARAEPALSRPRAPSLLPRRL